MAKVRRYRVSGRVQGVGYRAFVWRRANELGVKGWVRNMEDGTVEALAETTVQGHQAFESALREGSSWARVEFLLVVEENDHAEVPTGFSIVRDGI